MLCYHRGPSLKWGGSAPFLQSDDIFMKTSQTLLLSNIPSPLHFNIIDYLKIFLKVQRKKCPLQLLICIYDEKCGRVRHGPTRENARGLSQAPLSWASKVVHVTSVCPEPRCLVGKVCSVHVFENKNKSHHYEIIMSQVAWVKKKRKNERGGGAEGLTVGNQPVQLRSEERAWILGFMLAEDTG